jgi:hypothetical protein
MLWATSTVLGTTEELIQNRDYLLLCRRSILLWAA